ncbi:MAG TPA: DUF58 domain-containing protein [Thermoanaerobaculia bacterium]|nr:DUF58 domain-containing protein [Thermoanaerobaculia bacterium]
MRPTRAALVLASAWLALAVAAAFLPVLLGPWIACGAGAALLLAADAVAVRRLPAPEVRREVAPALPLGEWTRVRLRLANRSGARLRLIVFDHPPPAAELRDLPQSVALPRAGGAEIVYRLRPTERGDHRFAPADLLVASPLRLWRRRLRTGEGAAVRVLPNFQAVARYALLALDDRLGAMGVRLRQRRGTGLEFHELRDYRHGDSMRQVDWKATARRQKLISREYQDERNQQLVVLLDCGRRLRSRDGELAHFDHVLNAVLLLAYAALRQGDALGLLTFAGEERWLAPVKGTRSLARVLHALYDLETTTRPPDYLEAARRLRTLQKRRALVVLVTNLREEDEGELLPALRMLRPLHLVLVASLRETVLGEVLAVPPDDHPQAVLAAATHHYLEERDRVRDRLRGRGILTLDVEPAELPVSLVNRYLDVKRSGLL